MSEKRAQRAIITKLATVVGLVALAAAVRFYAIGAQPLWIDEAFSTRAAARPIREMTAIGDVHPPLYYAILHFWQRLGDDEATLRALSALFSVAALPFVYATGVALSGAPVGVVAALLCALASFQVRYAQEARMYALLMLAASVAMWGLARILVRARAEVTTGEIGAADRSAWIAYVLGTALMLWTQHTGWLFVIAANACVLALALSGKFHDRALLRRWTWAQIAVVTLWLPVAPLLVRNLSHVSHGFWIPPVTIEHVVEATRRLYLTFYLTELGPLPVLVLVGAAVAGVWAWRRRAVQLAFCTTLLVIPFGAEVASQLAAPILLERTLIWTAVPFYLLVAAGVASARAAAVRTLATTAVVASVGLDLGAYYQKHRKEAWDEAAARVAARAQDADLIVFVPYWIDVAFDYYFRRHGHNVESYKTKETPVTDASLRLLAARAATHPKVWLVESDAEAQDPGGRVPESLRSRCDETEHIRLYLVEVLAFERCR